MFLTLSQNPTINKLRDMLLVWWIERICIKWRESVDSNRSQNSMNSIKRCSFYLNEKSIQFIAISQSPSLFLGSKLNAAHPFPGLDCFGKWSKFTLKRLSVYLFLRRCRLAASLRSSKYIQSVFIQANWNKELESYGFFDSPFWRSLIAFSVSKETVHLHVCTECALWRSSRARLWAKKRIKHWFFFFTFLA